MRFIRRLASFDGDIDFSKGWRIGRWISAVVIVLGVFSLVTSGLALGIDFKGGTAWVFKANGTSSAQIRDSLKSVGIPDATVQTLELDGRVTIRVEVGTKVDQTKAAAAMAKTSRQSVDAINADKSEVGPSWGRDVSQKALRALIVFFITIAAYISWKQQWRMAVAAIVAVFHDIAISVGVYAIFQFPVTPGTVVAFLTILGYSLYDTIVVYDKVKENDSKVTMQGDVTYSEMMNLSLNQAFMRSFNTTLSTVLPVAAILFIGSQIMGAVTLQEFGMALFVGMLVGAYSSLFVAPPIVVWLKEREPRNKMIRERIEAARAGGTTQALSPVSKGAIEGDAAASVGAAAPAKPAASRTGDSLYSDKHPPRPRKQGKKR